MKRRGRKTKVIENSSNGVSERQDQNGEASERDDQELEEPEDKRKKTSKRKSASKKVEENGEENEVEDSEEAEDKKKKLNKRKSASKKDDEEEQNAHEGSKEPDNKRRKSNKRKSSSKKIDERHGDNKKQEELEEPDEKRKKTGKRKSASKKAEEEEDTQYEVEQILEEKMIQGVRHYLIRWKGYEPESDTWEPESTLNCSELIAEFRAKMKKRNRSKVDKKQGKKKSASDEQQSWDENEDFEVDRILDVYFKRNGQREFLVSWKGYPQSQNSWEPEENMDCKELIKKFMDKVEKAKESDQRELRIKRKHTDRLTLLSDGHLGRRLSKRNLKKQRVHYYDAE